MNQTTSDTNTFKEELKLFETDCFIAVDEFTESYKEELSALTTVNLHNPKITFAEQAEAIEEAQRKIFGHSINDQE